MTTSWRSGARAREALLRAACTLQYDSAVLPGTQLGVPLRPEPFSELKQRRSRLDGQVEEMDDNAPRRPLLPVTAPEPNGHLRREEEQAAAEQRLPRHAYKQLPLTGAAQSMMPMYRRPDSFGRIQVPDEYGYYPPQPERKETAGWRSLDDMYEATPRGEVTGLRLPSGEEATAQDIQADADAWATSFARDQRSCFIQNHDHDCTGTCVKYQQKKKGASETQPRAGQKLSGVDVPKCRFRFYKYVMLLIEGVIKFVMRRGKELVPTAVVSTGNDENEYGKAVAPRTMPFTSSSSDVLQATIRCNADYQYQKRGVPDLSATEQEAAAASSAQTAADQARFLMFGCRRTAGKMMGFLMTTLATAMRAAHVADFYMTKYLSKAQESLGSVLQPFIVGMRRTEDWGTTLRSTLRS